MSRDIHKKKHLSSFQLIILGFASVILLGAIILMLPVSSAEGVITPFNQTLFTSTSAVCVTGLAVLDTGSYWSVFGQVVILLLIQIGGLGVVTVAVSVFMLSGRKISLMQRSTMQNAISAHKVGGIVRLTKFILKGTLFIEMAGALALLPVFYHDFGRKGIWMAVFHSISAFCNAGFDVLGKGNSLISFNTNVVVIMVLSILIIIGGLGFTVWSELYTCKSIRRVSIHSKMVLLITTGLVVGGTLLMFLFEHNNPQTISKMSFINKLTNSFFASVTPRTAGFNSISTSGMTTAGQFLTIILMFIGGSPGSTAGGIKTTTIGVLIVTVVSVIRGREDSEVFKRRFSKDLVYKAFTLLFIGFTLVVIVTMLLSYTEKGATFMSIFYETISAFGTAGLTLGLTPDLSNIGRILIIIMMYLGRVGPLTVVLSLTRKKEKSGVKYPEGKILIG